jgi:hypothetical protein
MYNDERAAPQIEAVRQTGQKLSVRNIDLKISRILRSPPLNEAGMKKLLSRIVFWGVVLYLFSVDDNY